MVTLTMTRTVDGSLNGRDVTTYRQGETYSLPDQGPQGLAAVFLREGWAVPAAPAPPSPPPAPEPPAAPVPAPAPARGRRRR